MAVLKLVWSCQLPSSVQQVTFLASSSMKPLFWLKRHNMVIIVGQTFHFHTVVNWSMCGLIELIHLQGLHYWLGHQGCLKVDLVIQSEFSSEVVLMSTWISRSRFGAFKVPLLYSFVFQNNSVMYFSRTRANCEQLIQCFFYSARLAKQTQSCWVVGYFFQLVCQELFTVIFQ